MMQIKTKDLWESAFVLSEGGELAGITVDASRGRKEVTFVLTGARVEGLARTFESGQAKCNVTRLRASMSHLKEVLFRRIGG